MFQALRKRMDRDEQGFTLIELMVVVLIIAILIAIAIPTFLGARTRAQDRASQVDLRQGLLTAKAFYTDNETFLSTDIATTATAYEGLEPSLDFGAAASDTVVGVMVASGTQVVLAKKSKSGQWACIAEDSGAQTLKFITNDKPAANPYTTYASCADTATSDPW